jgi:ectoine hydroxylase-related dioxygenase (phytanoyl-CoA dioxygenase family)
MLSEDQMQHYFREGYVVAPGLIPKEELKRVLDAAPSGHASGGGWAARCYNHAEPDEDASIHQLLAEPNIVGVVRQIFANEPRIYYGMLAIVPANGGTGLPWHQDNQYTQILGGALNAFIALEDITPDRAILWVAPRSHTLGTQPSKETELENTKGHREAVVEPENGMPLPTMQAGDVCFFDRNTYHRSLKNETDTPRYAYAAQYTSQNARTAKDGTINGGFADRPLAIDLKKRWEASGALAQAAREPAYSR